MEGEGNHVELVSGMVKGQGRQPGYFHLVFFPGVLQQEDVSAVLVHCQAHHGLSQSL